MSKSLVVISYSPSLLSRREVVVPDATDPPNWDQNNLPGHVARLRALGEGVLIGTLADYHSIGPDAMLARQFSLPAVSDRCLVVNGFGTVIAVQRADPKMDQHKLGRMVHDPQGLAVDGSSIVGLGLS